ncbi:MAG TPA: Cof-type HAD-IIB family hydrolase [Gemmatimonadaceae bacterium]|nr:Cof-type HAD-IIB family hydrolase [Gemmatimonadaceae bacterium]
MIQLVCIDVDGTLVGSSGTVLPESWAAAARARARGMRLAICSGRPAFGITGEYAERLDQNGWHIFQNGASILHLATGESRSACIALEIVRDLISGARRGGRLLELYTDTAYAVESTGPRARAHAGLLGVPFVPRPFESLHGSIVRAQWLMAPDDLEALQRESHPGLEVSPSLSPVMPDTLFVNLTPVGVDKASAVRAVAGAYGVPLEEVMLVGDGLNDAAAMREVGYPVAMGNAEPEVLAIARRTVKHVDEGGLAEALALALDA